MAQFYTLDEAANRLGIPQEEFKRRLKLEWTSIRPFRDGATLRFRAADIDELARSLGAASDPGLQPGPVGAPPAEEEGSSEFDFNPGAKPLAKDRHDEPLNLAMSDSEITLPASDSGVLGVTKPKSGKGDSDVRLDLHPGKPHDPEAAVPTEEIALDLSGPKSGVQKPPSSAKLSAPKSGTNLAGPGSAKIPGPAAGNVPMENTDSSSEFELSLDADSDSFELQMAGDSSEEVDLGMIDSSPDTGSKASQSGINLNKPADTGVSLEKDKKGPKSGPPPGPADDSDVDFELSLEPSSSSGKLIGPKSGSVPRRADDSDSEFELTLDDNSGVVDSLGAELKGDEAAPADQSKGDIFETDFELPAMADESGSEVVSVDAADTDLEATGFEVDLNDMDAPADDESASQVVLVDDAGEALIEESDEDVLADAALDEGPSASRALRGVRPDTGEEAVVRTVPVPAAPAKWGPLPAIALGLALVPMFLGTLMAFEILRSAQGYSQGGKPTGTLARGIADMFGMKVND